MSENNVKINEKPSKMKFFLVLGALVVAVGTAIPITKYLSSHVVDEKKFPTELVKYEKNRHEAFKQNDKAIAQAVFAQFPNAKTILMGNVGIGDNGYSVFVHPTALEINNSSQIDIDALHAEKEYGIFCVTGGLTEDSNKIITSVNIQTYKKDNGVNPLNDAIYTFNVMSTDVTPYKIFHREDVVENKSFNQKIIDSQMKPYDDAKKRGDL